MDRRAFNRSLLMALASTGVASSGFAYDSCGVHSRELELALSKFPTRAIGPQHHNRLVYVFLSPWCPYCEQLVEDAVNGQFEFSVRALPSGLRNSDHVNKAASLILDEDFEISSFFGGRPIKKKYKEDQLIRLESAVRYTKYALEGWNGRFRQKVYGTPIWALLQNDGFNTFSGYGRMQRDSRNRYILRHGSADAMRPDESAMALSRRFIMRGFVGDERNTWHTAINGDNKLRVFPITGSVSPYCISKSDIFAGEARFSFGGERWVLFRGKLDYTGAHGWFDFYGLERDFPFHSFAT